MQCRRVPKQCKRTDRSTCPSKSTFFCTATNGRKYELPRRFSRCECEQRTRRGFTARASCAPFRGSQKKRKSMRKRMERSVTGTALKACSTSDMPTTGFTRNRMCAENRSDRGSHHVCLKDVSDGTFCTATGQTNWCAHSRDWCVCEWAFDDAVRKVGCDVFRVKCDATNQRALDHYDARGMHDAASCIRRQCTRRVTAR